MQKKGNKYGTHRVIEPQGLLTQAAKKIDNTMECWSNEILCDVSALNIDSASFTQIYEACGKDLGKTEQMILDIVNERGKMQNPVTGSGGMFIGTGKEIGEDLQGKIDLKVGDKVALEPGITCGHCEFCKSGRYNLCPMLFSLQLLLCRAAMRTISHSLRICASSCPKGCPQRKAH